MINKLSRSILKLCLYIIIVLSLAFSVLAASANYGEGTYGNGTYGKADPTTETTTTTAATDSGSSGGGVAASPSLKSALSSTHVWSAAKSGDMLSMNVKSEEIGISKIEVLINKDVSKAEISVQRLSEKPPLAKEVGSNVYQYLDINKKKIENNDIDTVVIRFEVAQPWIDVNAITKDNIVLKHFKGDIWENLPTILINDNSTKEGFVSYEAEASSLSYFAIAVKEPSLLGAGALPSETCSESWECSDWGSCAEGKETRACNDINSCNTISNKPSDSRDCIVEVKAEEKIEKKPGFIKWLFAVFGILIFSAVLFFGYSYYSVNKEEISEQREKIKKEASLTEYNIPDEYIHRLQDYIIKELGRGFSEERIKYDLIRAGWPREVVEEQFKKIM